MKFTGKLKEYQRDAVAFHLKAGYSICAFQMGLGKTVVALAMAVATKSETLIVCPAFLIPNWKEEINKFTDSPNKFTLVSYSSLKKVKDKFEKFNLVICDEVHYAKHLTAKRTQLLHELIRVHRPKYFIGLSGTPVQNRVPEFYSLLKLCSYGNKYPAFKKYSGSDWVFNMKFCNKKQFAITRQIRGEMKTIQITRWEGMRNLADLKLLLKPVYNRKKDDGSLNLPSMQFHKIQMSEKSKMDVQLEKAWEIYEGAKGDNPAASSSKAVNALAKIDFTYEFVMDRIEEAEKFIIFTDHVQAGVELKAKFGGSAELITGSVPADIRHQLVTKLNSGEIKILISTIGSLKEGANIVGVNHMVFNDFPWVWAVMHQVIKRMHRIGQVKACHYYYILSGKADKKILETVRKKAKLMEALDNEA